MEENKVKTEGDAIVERIISDGKKESEKIIADAEAYAENAVAEAEKSASEYILKERESAKLAAEDVFSGKRTLSALEEKKIILRAKQELVETVYLRAKQKLLKMGKEEFSVFIEKLVSTYGEEGDEVVLPENSPLTVSEAENLPPIKKLGLKVMTGNIEGGIVLSGKNCDKDLTFSAILESVREKTEAEIASKLFD